jgi:hypothetical protein
MPSTSEVKDRSGKIALMKLDGTEDGIEDGTPIVRYMKLETFLLLLAGQVFIPSHELLASLDPLEGKLVFGLRDRFWEDHAKDICERLEPVVGTLYRRGQSGFTGLGARLSIRGADGIEIKTAEEAKADFRIWMSELSRERCVWCWNRFKNESHALWQLYGNRGVAVHSTVGKVKDALLRAGVRREKVAPVAYVDTGPANIDEVFPSWKNVFFPHFLKSVNFEYEKEIRFVLRTYYEVNKVMKGVMVQIDARSIFSDPDCVTVSPQLQLQERTVVHKVINGLKDERWTLPFSEDWAQLYNRCQQESEEAPFPTEDKTPKAFNDLD